VNRTLPALSIALLLTVATAGSASAAKPDIDPSYVDGRTVAMIGPHVIDQPSAGLYARAEELYFIVYPINPDGRTDLGHLVLPSGSTPQCDPCFHPGVPLEFGYHDHVLTGAPGLGGIGTAGVFVAPWKIVVLMYDPAVIDSPDFAPVTSEAALDAAETAGWFLPINDGADNPFELETGQVLICPITSWHA
jgi:hypothetical protein